MTGTSESGGGGGSGSSSLLPNFPASGFFPSNIFPRPSPPMMAAQKLDTGICAHSLSQKYARITGYKMNQNDITYLSFLPFSVYSKLLNLFTIDRVGIYVIAKVGDRKRQLKLKSKNNDRRCFSTLEVME